MLAYAEKHGIPVTATASKPFSEDENLLHISHEAGILEDPNHAADENVYSHTKSIADAPNEATTLTLTFENGVPVKVENKDNGTTKTDALEIFEYLNEIGSENGIGRLDMVENRFVGIKSRGVYETPGGTILHNALRDLEGLTMDKNVMRIRDMLAPQTADVIYNGFWFSPEMDLLLTMVNKAQEFVNGTVDVQCLKGCAYPVARASETTPYDADFSSMDIEGGYNQEDAEGFIKINAIRLMANTKMMNKLGANKADKAA